MPHQRRPRVARLMLLILIESTMRYTPNVMNDRPSHNHTATPPATGLLRNITEKASVAISIRTIHMIPAGEKLDMKVASHRELMATTIIHIPITKINISVTATAGIENIQIPAISSSMPRAMLHPQLEATPEVKTEYDRFMMPATTIQMAKV